MTKRRRVIYWITTIWLALGMASTGIVQIIQPEEQMAAMRRLGYPDYFFLLLGIWKIIGIVVILIPKTPILKEWAYAGFFFTVSGAVLAHALHGDGAAEFIAPVLLMALTIASWYLRPAGRRPMTLVPRTALA